MRKTLIAGLAALVLAGSANATTVKTGANFTKGKTTPVIAVNQALYNKGGFTVVGEVEKEATKPFAMQGSLVYSIGPNSITACLKEGIDAESDPFKPGYLYPGVFYGRKIGDFSTSIGARGFFPKNGPAGYCGAVSAGYRWKNLGIDLGVAIPIKNWKWALKPMISCSF